MSERVLQSPALARFYKEYNVWLEAGSPPNRKFHRTTGLCTSLLNWSGHNYRLARELTDQLKQAGLCTSYPFNNGSGAEYRSRISEHHLNNDRVAWVRHHATAEDQAFLCWSCRKPVTLQQHGEADGHCPHCNVEIYLDA